MSFNKIRIVDASFQVEKKLSFEVRINFVSFQFYEHLIEIDLSSNIIENIEDKSFAAQKYLIKLDLSHNKIQDIKPKVNRISTIFLLSLPLKNLKIIISKKIIQFPESYS